MNISDLIKQLLYQLKLGSTLNLPYLINFFIHQFHHGQV
jgi:hypothetical protein